MLDGAVGTPRLVWNLLQNTALLLCVSLAVTPAFKMKFWNIGGEGQILIGGFATAACMIFFGGKLPNYVLIPIMVVVSVAVGARVGAAVAVSVWLTGGCSVGVVFSSQAVNTKAITTARKTTVSFLKMFLFISFFLLKIK